MNPFIGIDRIYELYQALIERKDFADLIVLIATKLGGRRQNKIFDRASGLTIESFETQSNIIWTSEVVILSYDEDGRVMNIMIKATNDKLFNSVASRIVAPLFSYWGAQENMRLFKIVGSQWLVILGSDADDGGAYFVGFMSELNLI